MQANNSGYSERIICFQPKVFQITITKIIRKVQIIDSNELKPIYPTKYMYLFYVSVLYTFNKSYNFISSYKI